MISEAVRHNRERIATLPENQYVHLKHNDFIAFLLHFVIWYMSK